MTDPIRDDVDANAPPSPILTTCRIIAGALMAGVAFFGAIVIFNRLNGANGLFAAPSPWELTSPKALISLLAVGMAAVMIPLSYVVPRLSAAGMRRSIAKGQGIGQGIPFRGETIELRAAYQTRMIIGLAMLEGAAFFNLIAFMLEGRAPTLIAAGVLLVLMASRFPTEGAMSDFVEDQRALMLEERQSA